MAQPTTVEIGQQLPERSYTPGAVQLFLYNAAIWNAHRIHYDLPYAQEIEGHPTLLVDGPLQGDWLTQLVYDWMEEGDELLTFQYSNRRAAYVNETLSVRGEIQGIENDQVTLALQVVNPQGQPTSLGRATVKRRDLG